MSIRKWNRDLILKIIRSQHRQGKDLSYNAMCRWNQALVSASNYHYGSYKSAVAMAGIDYGDIRRKPHWTAEKIVTLIRRAKRQGEDLSWRAVSGRRDELGRAAMAAVHPQLFGAWNAALSAAGLQRERVSRYQRWTCETILETLRNRIARRKPVNGGLIQREIPGLYGAALRLFGSWDEALVGAGIPPEEIRQRRKWTAPLVLQQLKAFEREHGTLAQTTLRRIDSGLLRAAVKFFGGFPEARERISRRKPVQESLFRESSPHVSTGKRRRPAASRPRPAGKPTASARRRKARVVV